MLEKKGFGFGLGQRGTRLQCALKFDALTMWIPRLCARDSNMFSRALSSGTGGGGLARTSEISARFTRCKVIANGIHSSRCFVRERRELKGPEVSEDTVLSFVLERIAVVLWIQGNSAAAQGCQPTSTSSKSQGLSRRSFGQLTILYMMIMT